MAEEATATETTNQVEVEATSQSQVDGDVTPRSTESYEQEIEKLRRENAKYRTERNEYRDDAEAFRKIQEAEKTELQRTQEALEAERAKARQFQVELARSQALAKYGISEDNADLLGSDPERFDANAKRLGQLQEQAAKKSAPPSEYPVEDLKPGASDVPVKPDFSVPSSWPVTGPFAKKDH